MSQKNAEEQLQTALTTTFLANLVFLKEYDNNLYQKVDELSKMINEGIYKEKYALDFIKENGDFDIYDLINDKYLYNQKPKKINNDLVQKVQFDEKESIFTLENIFTIKENFTMDPNIRFDIKNYSQSVQMTISDISKYTNTLKDFLENKKKRLKKIKKFIFIGTLLGRHIPKIAEKVDADLYLVCERNLEIFRLSLFTVDYTVLAKKGVIFSIMDNPIQEEEKMFQFFNINSFDNYLIKFSSTRINVKEYIDYLLSSFMCIKPTSYDYNRYLYTFINRSTKSLNSSYKTLLINKIKNKSSIFKNHPVLFIGAGPSLDENILWIKNNQSKFFIVTIGAAYKKLLQNDIKINLIITLDEKYEELNMNQFDDESVSLINDETLIAASCMTDSRILEKFKKDNLFLYEIFAPFHRRNIELTGFSVGEIAIQLLLNMNVNKLYLIGLDMALNQDTGKSHFEGNSEELTYNFEEENRDVFGLREGLLKVKGNLEKEVYTTAVYYTSIKYIDKYLSLKNDDTNIYNLSKHGAYFNNSIPTKVENINFEDFEDLKFDNKTILNLFNASSLSFLENNSKSEIQKVINFIRNNTETSFKQYKEQKYTTYEDFLYGTIKQLSLITDYEFKNSSIAYILRNYSQIILPYLSYHFNDLKIKNESKKIEKIKKIFTDQIEQILYDYMKFLERVV